MKPMTDARKAEIRERLEKITLWPWKPFVRNNTTAVMDTYSKEIIHWMGFDRSEISRRQHNANARFVAHAPEDVSNLLADNALLEKEAGNLRVALGQYARHEKTCTAPCDCGLGNVLRGEKEA